MRALTEERPTTTTHTDDTVRLRRRTIDKLLIGTGAVAAVVFAAAGGLLLWGSNFAEDYVHDELASQNVVFPDEASLRDEGRNDLVKYADEQVTTGSEADELEAQRDSLFRGEVIAGLVHLRRTPA